MNNRLPKSRPHPRHPRFKFPYPWIREVVPALTWVGELGRLRLMKSAILAGWAMLTVVQAADVVPTFRLQDTNLRSVRQGARVTPRDYLYQVSGYYFGAAG
jgi:hypothetical protein